MPRWRLAAKLRPAFQRPKARRIPPDIAKEYFAPPRQAARASAKLMLLLHDFRAHGATDLSAALPDDAHHRYAY